MASTILLVNQFSPAQYVSQSLKAKNIVGIALFTVAYDAVIPYLRPNPNLFDKQIYLESNNPQQLLAAVNSYHFDFILNGNDDSLLITEQLITNLLPEYQNENKNQAYRSNKFNMQEAFKLNGLPYIKQLKFSLSDNEAKILKLVNTIGFPCFIKPVQGAASIGASFCYNYQDLLQILNTKLQTATNQLMNEYIIQEIIEGQEIFVDIFSVHGRHYVSSVQTISKEQIHNASCYRTETLIYDKKLWDNSVALVKKALDACGFRNGFTHTELFYLPDGSFRIIEINPRMSGARGLPNLLAKYHQLNTQIDLLASYLHSEQIIESDPHNIHGYGEILYLYNFTQFPTKNIAPQLEKFQTIVEIIPCSAIGSLPPKIKNLANIDAMLLLYNSEDKMRVISEAKKIRELETAGLLF